LILILRNIFIRKGNKGNIELVLGELAFTSELDINDVNDHYDAIYWPPEHFKENKDEISYPFDIW
jgi:hypothetical protein